MPINIYAKTASSSMLFDPFYTMFIIAFIALLPVILVLTTNFTKIIVVLSILRQALGTPQAPPNIVLASLAIILTGFSMYPVIKEIEKNIIALNIKGEVSFNQFQEVAKACEKPIKNFLYEQTTQEDRNLFLELHDSKKIEVVPKDTDLIILAPSFLIAQLSAAFKIGFLIYLPFVVVDMAIANLLMALGMQMLAPTTISLPFKLLLFVLVDGWKLIAQGLMR